MLQWALPCVSVHTMDLFFLTELETYRKVNGKCYGSV